MQSVEGEFALLQRRSPADEPHADYHPYQRRQVEDKIEILERLTASKNALYRQISLEGQISAQNDIADRSLVCAASRALPTLY